MGDKFSIRILLIINVVLMGTSIYLGYNTYRDRNIQEGVYNAKRFEQIEYYGKWKVTELLQVSYVDRGQDDWYKKHYIGMIVEINSDSFKEGDELLYVHPYYSVSIVANPEKNFPIKLPMKIKGDYIVKMSPQIIDGYTKGTGGLPATCSEIYMIDANTLVGKSAGNYYKLERISHEAGYTGEWREDI